MDNSSKKFDYKWIIISLCFLMVFVCLGFCSSNKSLYTFAITEALGISRSAFSVNDSFRYITTAVINLFFGFLVSKLGTKKMICAGFVCLIIAVLLYSVASSLIVFYIGGIFLGVGFSWTSTTMVGCVVNKWFSKNKGTIMGFVLAANGLGGALAVQIVSPLIYEEGNPFGYRNAYRLVALILVVVGLIMTLFLKENPDYIDTTETKADKKKSRGQSWVGIDFSDLIKKRYFYASLVCIFLTGLILQGISGVAAVHMKDVELDSDYIATVLSVHSIAITVFKLLTGFIYDRIGLKATASFCSIAAIVSIGMLALLTNSSMGMALAMIYGIIASMALPLETIMLPIYVGDLFGQKSYNKILGLFVSVNVAGYAFGEPVFHAVFDLFGTYAPCFVFCSILMMVVLVAMNFVINSAKRCRMVIESEENQ